jgi:hypothetical protein
MDLDLAALEALEEQRKAINAESVKAGDLPVWRERLITCDNRLASFVPSLIARVRELEAERDAYREALTPSGDTKAAYIGEFHMGLTLRHRGQEDYRSVPIEWTTIKEVMGAILARAALNGGSNG